MYVRVNQSCMLLHNKHEAPVLASAHKIELQKMAAESCQGKRDNFACTAFVGEPGDDESSSDGSVIRVPIRGGEEEEEEEENEDDDGYSSSGSVIRVDANEGAGSPDDNVLKAAVAINSDEEEGYSSDGSVIRVPAGKAGVGGVGGVPRKPAGEIEKGADDGNIDGNIGQPAHMKLNLLAASKYFGSKGGVLDVDPGAEAQRSGPGQLSATEDNPQVRPSRSFQHARLVHADIQEQPALGIVA